MTDRSYAAVYLAVDEATDAGYGVMSAFDTSNPHYAKITFRPERPGDV